MDVASQIPVRDTLAELNFARETLRKEAAALLQQADALGPDFSQAVEVLDACAGTVIVMGVGKAGLIGQKISATFCSTGTRSIFLHPAEAIHGDLGRVAMEDNVLALSLSGETEELVRVLPSLSKMSVDVLAITSRRTNTLGEASRVVMELGHVPEACELGLAPSTSTTAMLALGDALALTLSRRRGFTAHDFAKFHPGGSLGRKLTKVQDTMRPLSECRVASRDQTVRDVFVTLRRTGRRTGAVMIVDDQGTIVGVFTDSDLARILEQQADSALDAPVNDVMTRAPVTVKVDSLMPLAIQMLSEHHISELPVVDSANKPLGMIDITDVISWLPQAHSPAEPDDGVDAKRQILPFSENRP